MRNNDLMNATGGYIAGNAMANSISSNLQKEIDKMDAYRKIHPYDADLNKAIGMFVLSDQKEEGHRWLVEKMSNELIYDAQHQEKTFKKGYVNGVYTETWKSNFTDAHVNYIKNKYRPFFQKLGQAMPDTLESATAQSICELTGAKYTAEIHFDAPQDEPKDNSTLNWAAAIAVIIIGLFLLYFFTVAK